MNQRYKKFLKVFVIIFIAIVGLFVFSRGAEAAFSCDSGSTSTTCYITGAKTMTNGETVTGTGNLVIGATISSATSTDIVYFDFGGNITIGTSTAGSITTNFQATSTNFTINSNGSINVTGKGCAGGAVEISGQGGGSSCSAGGTGAGVGNAISGGGGGGHGASGGDGASGGAGGGTYDSITQPVLLGSGGGGGNNTAGGAGGGAIKIIISGTITINGAIIANGNTGTNSGSTGADTGGGGSGGSVWIQAGTLAGSSNITASGSKGGNSTAIGSGQYTGGGGAGGRIAVYYTNSSYSGTLTVSGAAGGTNSGTGGTGGTGGGGTTQYIQFGTWDGGGGANINWSTVANWVADTLPTASTTVTFNNTTTTNSTIDAGFAGTIANLNIASGYTGTVTLSRSLTVTGNATSTTGTFNANGQTISVTGLTTINGGTYQASTATSTFTGGLTLFSGTFTGSSGNVDIPGAFTISGSTFTAPSGTFTIGGNFTYSGGTFTHNSGTTTLNGSADATLDGGSGLTLNNLSINKTGAAVNASGTVGVAGNLTFTSGTLNGGGATINIGGNWPSAGSAFSAGTSTVNFNGGGGATQTISGANTFYNLTKNVTATSTLAFPASATTTIAGALTLTGTSTGKLLLRSSSDGTQWKIDAQGARTISNLDVKDSNNVNATSMNCLDGCDDSLNNTNWKFGEAGEFDPTFGVNGVSVSQIATTTDADWGKVKIQYKVKDLTVMPAGGWVTPSFYYSTSSGSTWTNISQTYLAAGDLDAKTSDSSPAFSNSAWATYSATWDATSTIPDFYSTNALIKVTISDGDKPANAAVDATSTIAVLDTKKPTATSTDFLINGSNAAETATSSVSLSISTNGVSDDSQVYIQFSNDNSTWYGGLNNGTVSGIAGSWGDVTTTGAVLGPWSWTLSGASRTRTVYARVTDVYGNVSVTTLQATAEQNEAPVASITNSPSLGLTGTTTVVYTISDADSSNTPADTTATTSLMYDIEITASAISSTSTTSVTANGNNKLKIAAGDVIQVDNEMMLVSSNTVGALVITTRGYRGTRAATHSASATIWIMANTVTGSICSRANFTAGTCTSVTNASGPFTINWTLASDVTATSSAARVMITANDGRTVNPVGTGASEIFTFDTIKPTVTSATLLINDSSSAVNASSSNITLKLQNITEDIAGGTIYIEFASSTTWFGANTGGTLTAGSLGSGMTVAQATATSWPWTLKSGTPRSETISVRVRDAYGNIANAAEGSYGDQNTASWNNTPEFGAQITVLQIATTTDANWGKTQIDYRVRDTDTNLSENASPGANYAKIKFEYSTGTVWTAIATSTITTAEGSDVWLGDYLKKSVSTGSYSSYTAYWNAVGQIPEVYSTTAKIRATVDDGEAILNTASSTSENFTLSTTKPVVFSNSLGINNDFDGTVIATSSTATLTLQNITGDTNETLYIQFGSSTSPTITPTIWYGASSTGALTSGGDVNSPSAFGSGMTINNFNSISWPWTLTSRTETIHVRVRDAYNNIADTVASSTASWNNAPEFQNIITSSQITNNADANWGKVKIDYSVRDTDSSLNASSTMAGFVNASFEYSTSSGATWVSIPAGYLSGDYGKKAVNTSTPANYTPYTANWDALSQIGGTATSTLVRVTLDDTEIIFNSATSTSVSFNLDVKRPSFSAFTAGTAVTDNIQFTDTDADGVADSRLVTLQLNNLVESSSSTQGVYVLFSNDGTNYGTSTDSNGALTFTASTSTIAQWEYIAGDSVAAYSKSGWYLASGGSRSKTVYALVKDAYGNMISSAASSTVTWNKKPQFSASEISDSDNSSILSASSTSGVMARQCDIYDTDANCGAGKVKLIYSVRDPDANESGLATKGQLATTFEYSLNGGGYTPFTIAGAATTTVATSSADVAGGYNPIYSTTTVYWDASSLGSGNIAVKITVDDREGGASATASSTSNIIAYDKTNPSGSNITFDAGVAGASSSAVITIPWWNDTNNATNTIQYIIVDDSTTHSSPSSTGWTSVVKNATTTRNWTFDSDIEAKSLDFNFRDIYGNTAGTTTASTINPISSAAFFIQDVSKVSINDWKLYISWESSTSTVFSNYSLEYATSSNNTDFGPYASVIYPAISDKTVNYYLHANLTNTWYYRYRIGVTDSNGNTTVRSNAYINARPDGIQNFGEGGGGTSASASVVTNIVPTQGSDGNIMVTYSLTDSSLSSKTSPTYEAYLLYDVGAALTASSTNTLVVSDSTKIPAYGFIQINQEVIGYTGNATSTGALSGITRGTWPSSGRATRVNAAMASSTPVWIFATSTGTTITNTSISSGQSGSVTWTTANDTNLAGYYLTNLGLRVLIHDNQSASSGPLSSQSDQSNDGVLAIFDKKAPVLTASSLLINSSADNVEASSTTAALSLAGVSGDTASEMIYIQFASSTNWFGANVNGTISATSSSWGETASIGGNLGPWTWPLSGRSETVSVRIKDAYGNISNTDTNSIIRNAVPEFGGSISDADASGYATTTSASGAVIRQCNVYDADPLCTASKVKIKFTARDADTDLGAMTAGSASTTIAISLNGGAYATTSLSAFTSDGSLNLANGIFAVATSTYSTVTVYYDPQLGSSANIAARLAITDNEAGSALQYAVSNTIAYDKIAPSGPLTFDAGIAGSSTTAVLTIPVPTDATTSQYMFTATTTESTASTTAWTTVISPASVLWGFDSVVGAKSVYYRFRDIYGNTTATATASALAPPDSNSITIEDISATTSARLFLSWPASSASDFANYRVEYATSTDNSAYGSYAELALITNKDTNYFIHSGLNNTLYYRYRLSMKNTAGNYSVKSQKSNGATYVAGKPDGIQNDDEAYANDTATPAVTNVSSGTPQVTSATISFSVLDNASLNTKSTVYYAVSSDYNGSASDHRLRYAYKFGNAGYAATVNNSTATTTTVTLSNLVKNSAYKFAVETCDVTGNCVLKEDTGDAPFTFTTANGPAIVVGPSATNNTYDTTTITWKTDKAADSIAYYSSSVDGNNNLVSPVTAGSNTQITTADVNPPNYFSHSVTLSSLGSGTYYYKARSSDTNGQYSESSVLSVAIPAQVTPDPITPSCSVTHSTITVNWTTNQDTTTEISVLSSNVPGNYFSSTAGIQTAQYPATIMSDGNAWDAWRSSADYSKNHSQTFTGLTENTMYHVKAYSENRSGGEVFGFLTCTTTATPAAEVIVVRPPVTDVTPPIISAVEIKDITATTVTIAWTTDELADTLVKHGTTMSYGSISGTEELSGNHSVMLGGLKPSVAYNFKITSADARGNRAYAGDQSFTTLSLPEAAQTTKDELEKLQKELKELKEKQESEAKKAQSLAEATARFKAILKSVASDVSLQDLEDLTTDISDTITDITQEVTPPNIIGGVPAVEIEANKATIKWKTNKMANSIIALAPQSDYNAQVKDPYTLQVGQTQEEVKEHIVTIPDLKPSTVYHFQIRSKAKVGPEGRSRDFVFETKPELPVIIDYSFKKITENSITVVWRTNVLSSSLVRYTPFSPDGDLLDKESKTQGNPAFVQAHEVAVTNLPPNVAYLVEISSKDVTGAEVSRVLGTVRTIVDVKAPVIAKVRADSTLFPGKVEKTQTIIYWETDEPSTSQIFWKEGMSKGDFADSSRLDMEYTTSHVMVMTNFKPGSVYRFQVESVDPAGNKSRSTDYTVLTPKKGETVIDLIINNFQDIFGFLRKM